MPRALAAAACPCRSAKPDDGAPPKPKRSKKLPETGPATYTTAERPPKWEGPAHRFMSWNVAGLRGVLKKVRHRPGGRHMTQRQRRCARALCCTVLVCMRVLPRCAARHCAAMGACLLPPCQDAAVLKMLVETEQVDVLCLQVSGCMHCRSWQAQQTLSQCAASHTCLRGALCRLQEHKMQHSHVEEVVQLAGGCVQRPRVVCHCAACLDSTHIARRLSAYTAC